jgi:ABC-2 type transport system ATP-binding protein
VALLNEGRVMALDTPKALQGSIDGRMMAVVSEDPRRARDVLRSSDRVRSAHLFGDALHVLVGHDFDPERDLEPVRAAGIGIDGVEETVPSLEDVFMSLLSE